jgi:hypothetical protein
MEVMKNHIAVTLDTLNMSIEDLTTTMPDGIKVDEFLAEIERTVVIQPYQTTRSFY